MIAYFDCFSGISGDMTLGAFIDLGVPLSFLKEEIGKLPLEGFSLSALKVARNGIMATDLSVRDLDGHGSRNYRQIRDLIEKSPLASRVKSLSLAMFKTLAQAEAAIHGCPADQVHFHEVGGVDAIVDMVGAALSVAYLGIDEVVSSPLPLGRGFITCAHGNLPAPSPATLAILKGAICKASFHEFETITPTGAAIIKTLASSFGEMPEMTLRETGYGSGKKEGAVHPNLLRIILGEKNPVNANRVAVIETTIDDMNPQILGYVMERLFEEGALDVCFIPVFMKKGRPGTQIQIIASEADQKRLIRLLLEETTTTGVRHALMERTILDREIVMLHTIYGPIQAKRVTRPDGTVQTMPEYESLKKISRERKLPLRTLFESVLKEL
jgi:hypothetical protein